jgi:hypothetical protein
MARNDRIFYACQAVAIVKTGVAPTAPHIARGLQSVGMNSNFSLDQIFEIGQLEIYENVEDVADIEVSLEKVIDGETLLFMLASNGLCKTDLVAAVKNRSDVYLSIFDDAQSNATGQARNVCWNSGCYISSVGYTYNVDGNATESLALVGNDRFWNSVAGGTGSDPLTQFGTITNGEFGSDTPASGVVRRTDIDLTNSTLPDLVKSQEGDLVNDPVGHGNYHLQSVSVSADFGQENLLELGRFGPYAKFVTFPIEVSCEFEVIATSGDLKSVSGINKNLVDQEIVLKDDAGTVIDLSNKNKLSSISYSGGDTGGGNSNVTYSYTNFNALIVDDGSDFSPS